MLRKLKLVNSHFNTNLSEHNDGINRCYVHNTLIIFLINKQGNYNEKIERLYLLNNNNFHFI